MDWQTNKGKPLDIDVGIKEVAQDSCGSSLRSDCISKIKTIRTQNINNVIIGNLNINSLSHDLKVLMTGMFAGAYRENPGGSEGVLKPPNGVW